MKKQIVNGRLPSLLIAGIALACGNTLATAADEGREAAAPEHHGEAKRDAHGKTEGVADPQGRPKAEGAPRQEAEKGRQEGPKGHGAAPGPSRKQRADRPSAKHPKARQAARRAEQRQAMMARAHELARDGKPEALRREAREQWGPAQRLGQGRTQPARSGDHSPQPNPMAKLRHLEQAIGHLREAGLPDPAQNLEVMARRLREDIQRNEGHKEGPPDIEALRREVRELREALRKAQEKP